MSNTLRHVSPGHYRAQPGHAEKRAPKLQSCHEHGDVSGHGRRSAQRRVEHRLNRRIRAQLQRAYRHASEVGEAFMSEMFRIRRLT